jgi:uncharacterized membrane protein
MVCVHQRVLDHGAYVGKAGCMMGFAAGTAASGFLAGLVEGVEALTVVLAVGAQRGWRSPVAGVLAGLASLAGLVTLLGPALMAAPLSALRLVLGVLLLLFGLRWLRKAILRAAGVIPRRDERAAYARAEQRYGVVAVSGWDSVGFAASFQIVLLEGAEVVFIVLALGAGGGSLMSASAGAAASVLLVAVLGVLLHRPVAGLPENDIKLVVGIILSAFGTFWTGEGLAGAWPGGDWMLAALLGFWALIAFAGVRLARDHAPVRQSA